MSAPREITRLRVRHVETGTEAEVRLRQDGTVLLAADSASRGKLVGKIQLSYFPPMGRDRAALIQWAHAAGYERADTPAPLEPGWKGQFHKAMIDYLVQRGTPVDAHNTTYGWVASDMYDLAEHLKVCSLVYPECTWDDTEWTEWGGTFDSDSRKAGIEAKVFCRCGEIAGRAWRYGDSYGDLIRAITGIRS